METFPKMMVLVLFAALGSTGTAHASDPHVATVVQVEGRAQIFHSPSARVSPESDLDAGAQALFEGKYYRVRDLRTSDRVENGNVVRTLPGARARVIYDNGDQIYLGPGSSYLVSWDSKNKKLPEIKLLYGRFRGVVSKEGPRKKIIIRTRTATMGVRGTDFYVSEDGPEETSIRVVRGAVEVTPRAEPPTMIETGMSAELTPQVVRVLVRKISREDLGEIRMVSALPAPSAVPEAVVKLEKQAAEVTIQDIRRYQPEVLQQIEKTAPRGSMMDLSAQALNAQVLDVAAASAPSIPRKRLPGLDELKSPDGVDYYERFFKERQ